MELNRKRGQLQAYIAGIMDGEGSFGIGTDGRTYTAKVTIQMDDPEAIALILREYPEARIYKRSRVKGRPYYALNMSHYKAERFIRDIEPFLFIKRDQARLLLSFLAHRRRDHQKTYLGKYGTVTPDCNGRCERFLQAIKAMKIPDPKGVNSVNALLDHELREYRAKREDVEEDVRFLLPIFQSLDEGVETSAEGSTPNKAISAPEKEIVHAEQ